MGRWILGTTLGLLAGALLIGGCGNTSTTGEEGDSGDGDLAGDGDSGDGGDGDSDTGGDGDSGDGDSGDGDSVDGGTQIIEVIQIPGGGSNSAPLAPGCGPETAQECTASSGGCTGSGSESGSVEVKDAGAVCFYGEGIETPSATVEHITETVNGKDYVHIRVIFDPNFVDTVYGECSPDTGWSAVRGHTFGDLVGSDHVELMLYGCGDELSMHLMVDFIEKSDESACGYATAGVTGGDGSVIVGSAEDILAVSTSLDRNLNGCGYCETVDSPCPSGDGFAPSSEAPEWDFRMVYELWIDADAFGEAGFCRPDIEYVHASPAKAEDDDTILVEPDDCPPPPGSDCPPNYVLYLSSEGEYLCAGPPNDGECPSGYELDLTSEGELCVPEGQQ